MHAAIMDVLKTNAHVNIADYLRDLVRKDLENRDRSFPAQRMQETKPIQEETSNGTQ